MMLKKCLIPCVIFNIFFGAVQLAAQVLPNLLNPEAWKLSPHFQQDYPKHSAVPQQFLVHVNDWTVFKNYLEKNALAHHIVYEYEAASSFILKISPDVLFDLILPCENVIFVDDRSRQPQEERAIDDFDLGINRVNVLHHLYPELHGQNRIISIKESRFDSLDIDFKNRYFPSDISAPSITTHATNMATMAAGGGNAAPNSKGVAWKAGLSSSDFLNLFPDDMAYFDDFDIHIQNHSYGLGIENYYGSEAFAYDHQVYQYPHLVHVFSAGNLGDTSSTTGIYQGLDGFANLTGTFKMAKNILTVGAIDSTLEVAFLSSKGPAYDGRIKPELVAFGSSGSSGAAAITSGVVALMQQVFEAQTGNLLPAALVRAVLLNSAEDIGEIGPDYASGFGNMNALAAIQTIVEHRVLSGYISNGATNTFSIQIPENAINFKATLAWTDPPAEINADKAIVHDLDFSIKQLDNNEITLPWVLNAFPDPNFLQLPAIRGIDRLNNQEQITLARPAAGNYECQVEGYDLSAAQQEFFIAYAYDTIGEMQWLFPTADDALRANAREPLRWKSTLEAETAHIEYTFIGSEDWFLVAESADLIKNHLYWRLPDTTALLQLRMRGENQTWLSDTFTVTQPMKLSLGFDCVDSVQLVWKNIWGIDSFQLWTMGETYLEPLVTTSDTFVVLAKNDISSPHFAVAPFINAHHLGRRSPTLNLDFQFSGCYIQNFLVRLINERTLLDLSLGTLYQVKNIVFEKYQNGTFAAIRTFQVENKLKFQYEDEALEDGTNIYRAAVTLENGQTIYSDELSIFYTSQTYFVYPNPVSQQEDIKVISKRTNGAVLFLYDSVGRLVVQLDILNANVTIPTGDLPNGVYFYKVVWQGTKEAEGKILIY